MKNLAIASALGLLATSCTGKEMWITQMEVALPLTICEADYFEDCFDWSSRSCADAAKPLVAGCLDDMREELPSSFGPINGGEWGGKVGGCAGERLASQYLDNFTLDAKCEQTILDDLGREQLEAIRAEINERKGKR